MKKQWVATSPLSVLLHTGGLLSPKCISRWNEQPFLAALIFLKIIILGVFWNVSHFPSYFFFLLTLVTCIFNSIATEIVLNWQNRILFCALHKICQEMRSDLLSKNTFIFSLWFALPSLSRVVLIFFTYLFYFFLLQSFFALLLLYLIAPCWYKSICPVYRYQMNSELV